VSHKWYLPFKFSGQYFVRIFLTPLLPTYSLILFILLALILRLLQIQKFYSVKWQSNISQEYISMWRKVTMAYLSFSRRFFLHVLNKTATQPRAPELKSVHPELRLYLLFFCFYFEFGCMYRSFVRLDFFLLIYCYIISDTVMIIPFYFIAWNIISFRQFHDSLSLQEIPRRLWNPKCHYGLHKFVS
jgi:hypothetical protein